MSCRRHELVVPCTMRPTAPVGALLASPLSVELEGTSLSQCARVAPGLRFQAWHAGRGSEPPASGSPRRSARRPRWPATYRVSIRCISAPLRPARDSRRQPPGPLPRIAQGSSGSVPRMVSIVSTVTNSTSTRPIVTIPGRCPRTTSGRWPPIPTAASGSAPRPADSTTTIPGSTGFRCTARRRATRMPLAATMSPPCCSTATADCGWRTRPVACSGSIELSRDSTTPRSA